MAKYRVTGDSPVLGHQPGEVFEIHNRNGVLIAPGGFEHSEQEYLDSGRLEKVRRGEEPKPEEKPEPEAPKIGFYRQED